MIIEYVYVVIIFVLCSLCLWLTAMCKRAIRQSEVTHSLLDLELENHRKSEALWREKETKQFAAYARLEDSYMSLRSKLRELSK